MKKLIHLSTAAFLLGSTVSFSAPLEQKVEALTGTYQFTKDAANSADSHAGTCPKRLKIGAGFANVEEETYLNFSVRYSYDESATSFLEQGPSTCKRSRNLVRYGTLRSGEAYITHICSGFGSNPAQDSGDLFNHSRDEITVTLSSDGKTLTLKEQNDFWAALTYNEGSPSSTGDKLLESHESSLNCEYEREVQPNAKN